jgi:hypothetical protein
MQALSSCPDEFIFCDSPAVQPNELVRGLIDQSGERLTVVANRIQAGFQPTLHKFVSGRTREPSRQTAALIAEFFRIPLEALYDEEVATKVAAERGIALSGGRQMNSKPDAFPRDVMESIDKLYAAGRHRLELVIRAALGLDIGGSGKPR